MWDFSIPRALSLMGQTLPFIIFRIIVYAGIAVAYVLVTGLGAGNGWGIGAFGDADFQGAATFWSAVAIILNAWSAGGLVFALIFAWAVKVALIEPLRPPASCK